MINTSFHRCYRGRNSVILIALHKEISIPQPSEVLIRKLLATNLCVVLHSARTVSNLCSSHRSQHFVIFILVWHWPAMTLTAKSVARLLALLLGRRYRQIVALSREYLVQSYWSLGLARYRQYRNLLIPFRLMQNNLVVENNSISSAFCYCFTFSSTCGTNKFESITILRSNGDNQYHLIHAESSALWLQMVIAFCCLPKAFDVPIRLPRTEL